ncbi:MAG: phospho-N-acetylmuramoyl-pentapeptide-transferase [Clostridiales bacterium]|nr:phospho-N-acetylmuramoyl-pentapeptide-transferase [Clostridiales bacterium]
MIQIILPIILAFAISCAIGPFLIPYLRKLKFGQTEREEGVQSHLKKAGTPTMGGVIFLVSIIITSVFFIPSYHKIVPVLLLTVGFGLIGFVDDYLKVVKKNSDGLLPLQKLIAQAVITAVFALYMVKVSGISLEIRIPFFGENTYNIGFLAIILLFIAVIGTVNGTNFTDGLDGLCSSVTVVVAGFFTLVSAVEKGGVEPICAAVIGALMGFLVFNAYPAKIFMGDTGSLALGGFVAGVAYVLQMPIFILIVGLVYLVEVLSVMIQVTYFKKTGGKRIFKMAPIHHHFELCGWSETRVVTVFTIVTVLLCCVAWIAL